MSKKLFNGLNMPAIAVRRLNGRIEVVRRFGYTGFSQKRILAYHNDAEQGGKKMKKNVLHRWRRSSGACGSS